MAQTTGSAMSSTPTLRDQSHGASPTSPGLPKTQTISTTASSSESHPKKTKTHKNPMDKPVKSAPPPGASGMTAPIEVSRPRFWAIFIALMLTIFLFALDQLILATAIPKITDEFHALSQIAWLTNGFFLTLLGFNLIYSQFMQIFPSKHVIAFAVLIFEIGSAVCGAAPSIDVLILGRAITGAGAAGLFSGAMIVIAEITTLAGQSSRPTQPLCEC